MLVLSLHEYGDAFLDCMHSALQASNVASQIGKGFHTNTNTHTNNSAEAKHQWQVFLHLGSWGPLETINKPSESPDERKKDT